MENKQKSNNKKNMTFVFLYAIGSILVVAGHCGNGGIDLAFDFFPIYAFHLGLFMFCSGYFYKTKNEENWAKYTWGKFKKLVIPMLIWNVVYGIFVQLTKLKGFTVGEDITIYNLTIAPFIDGHQFLYNMCFWYIPSLFLIQTITCGLRKILNRVVNINEYIFFIIYFMLGVLGIYLSNKGYNKGAYLLLVRTLYFFPFFGLGILYNKKIEKIDKLNNLIYFSIVIIMQLIIIFVKGKAPDFKPSVCNDFSKNLILPFAIGYLGIAFWLRVAKILEPVTRNSKVVNIIADNAYSIMAHQFFGFFIVKCIYAIASKFIPIFSDFDMAKFKSFIWYYYNPKGINTFYIIYLVAGVVIPIMIGSILKKIKELIIEKYKTKKDNMSIIETIKEPNKKIKIKV